MRSRNRRRQRKYRSVVKHSLVNPAGSKLLRYWYKCKTGMRGTYVQALAWYSKLSGRPLF